MSEQNNYDYADNLNEDEPKTLRERILPEAWKALKLNSTIWVIFVLLAAAILYSEAPAGAPSKAKIALLAMLTVIALGIWASFVASNLFGMAAFYYVMGVASVTFGLIDYYLFGDARPIYLGVVMILLPYGFRKVRPVIDRIYSQLKERREMNLYNRESAKLKADFKKELKTMGLWFLCIAVIVIFVAPRFGYEGMPIAMALLLLIFGSFVLAYAPRSIKLRRINQLRASISDDRRDRIERAFENVQEFTFQESMTVSDWNASIRLHDKLDGTPTEALKASLQQAGIFNPHAKQYQRGKTLEEGITLAVWQSRYEKEEAIKIATETEYKRATEQRKTVPDLQHRKEQEQQIEALERELARLKNQSQPAPRWETPDE